MNKITSYFREAFEEMQKVVWPSRRETIQHTLLVIGISVGVALFIGIIDFLLNLGLEKLIR